MKDDLHDLFVDQLRDILWAERKILETLPKLASKATEPKLQQAFSGHATETEGHVKRLLTILDSLGLSGRGKKCEALAGLVKEGDELVEEYAGTPAGDAALIAAAQKVEHYEIATYGTLRAFALNLGHKQAAKLLGETLEEEKGADDKLTGIAEGSANDLALGE